MKRARAALLPAPASFSDNTIDNPPRPFYSCDMSPRKTASKTNPEALSRQPARRHAARSRGAADTSTAEARRAATRPDAAKPQGISQLQRLVGNRAVQRLLAPASPAVGAEGGEAPADVQSQISQARGGGQPIDDGAQRQVGQVLGADLSRVRVHTDAQSDQLNQSLAAKAFTTGSDIFFSQGAYEPQSASGKQLLAHELAHVVQQGAAGPGPASESHTAQTERIQRLMSSFQLKQAAGVPAGATPLAAAFKDVSTRLDTYNSLLQGMNGSMFTGPKAAGVYAALDAVRDACQRFLAAHGTDARAAQMQTLAGQIGPERTALNTVAGNRAYDSILLKNAVDQALAAAVAPVVAPRIPPPIPPRPVWKAAAPTRPAVLAPTKPLPVPSPSPESPGSLGAPPVGPTVLPPMPESPESVGAMLPGVKATGLPKALPLPPPPLVAKAAVGPTMPTVLPPPPVTKAAAVPTGLAPITATLPPPLVVAPPRANKIAPIPARTGVAPETALDATGGLMRVGSHTSYSIGGKAVDVRIISKYDVDSDKPFNVGSLSTGMKLMVIGGKTYLFKPAAGENEMLLGKPLGIMPGAGVRKAGAVSELANLMGIRTPKTEIVEYGGALGSLQEFLQGAKSLAKVTEEDPLKGQTIKASQAKKDLDIFDYIIAQIDRHMGNFMKIGRA